MIFIVPQKCLVVAVACNLAVDIPPRRQGKEVVDLFDGSHSAKRVFNHLIIDDSIRFWAGCPEACVDLFVSWLSMDRWQQD